MPERKITNPEDFPEVDEDGYYAVPTKGKHGIPDTEIVDVGYIGRLVDIYLALAKRDIQHHGYTAALLDEIDREAAEIPARSSH